jgi:hypothetical protein
LLDFAADFFGPLECFAASAPESSAASVSSRSKLEQDLLVETKALLPAFELMTRLLGCFFVSAEVKDQE